MGQYDFETLPNRLKHHTYKWRETESDPEILAAWIADMDFVALPEVTQAIHDYAAYSVYGYTYASDSLVQAVLDWEKNEHHYDIDRQSLLFSAGVLSSLSVAIQAFTKEEEAILINTPVYPPFRRSVSLNNRKLVTNSLVKKNGLYQIDLKQLEKDFVDHQVKLYILCNPHNPGGRVWEKEVLKEIGQLCQKYQILLVVDEIHQDLTLFGHQHVSFNTISPDFKNFSIILSSATKTFNIAGVKNSFVIIENEVLRQQFQQKQLANNQQEVSTLGYLATEVAYRYGKRWLEELKSVLENNIHYVVHCFATELPSVQVMKPQGTYLVWLDFTQYSLSDHELFDLLHHKAKVLLNKGVEFGKEGKGHARLNVAAPIDVIKEICQRIANEFRPYEEQNK